MNGRFLGNGQSYPGLAPIPQGRAGPRSLIPVSIAPNVAPQGFQTPCDTQDDCLDALVKSLEGGLITTDLAPHLAAPFSARFIQPWSRAVINVPATFDALANAGGIALANANSLYQVVPVLTPPAGALPPFTALPIPFASPNNGTTNAFVAPAGHCAIFTRFGVTVENSADGSIANVSINVNGGPNNGIDPPNPLVSSSESDEQQPTLVILPENKALVISVQNLNTHSAILVKTVLSGWVIPLRTFRGTLKSLLARGQDPAACCPPGRR